MTKKANGRWIKLNLPYETREYFEGENIKCPNLNKRAKKELGFTLEDMDALYDKMSQRDDNGLREKFVDRIEKAVNKKFDEDSYEYDEWQAEVATRCLKSKNADVRDLGAWTQMRGSYNRWMEKQPEIIAYNEEYDKQQKAFNAEIAKKSFCGLGLNNVGVLVELEDEVNLMQYLIGDINQLGGVCDDCMGFRKEKAIVKRYKIVWSK